MRSLLRCALVVYALLALPVACFSPAYKNGGLVCDDRACPEGYYCHVTSNRCWRLNTEPPLEDGGAPADSHPDEAPDLGEVAGDADVDHDAAEVDVEPDLPPDPAAYLSSLEVMPGRLDPPFSPSNRNYSLQLPLFTNQLAVTATAENPNATVTLNGTSKPGRVGGGVPLRPGRDEIAVLVTSPGGGQTIYRINVNAGGVMTYVKPPVVQNEMGFGTSVALAASTLVVGAPNDKGTGLGPQTTDTPGTVEEGAAFVYLREGSQWRREVTLKPPTFQAQMRFGAAVAIAGDTIVVGAPGENGADGRLVGSGAVFVFVRGAGGWTQQAYLKGSIPAAMDQFGAAVAVSQITAAGGMTQTTLAVGAPTAAVTHTEPRTGVAYVFVRLGPAGKWTEQVVPQDTEDVRPDNEFGASVAIAGDTLVVGAPRNDKGTSGINPGSSSARAVNSGAAFLYTRANGIWPQPILVKAPAALAETRFGSRVVAAGNLIAISAPFDPVPPAQGAPAAHLYQRGTGTSIALLQSFRGVPPKLGDRFGMSLGLSPTTLVVGAPLDDLTANLSLSPAAVDSGAIYVFRPDEARWKDFVIPARLKASNADMQDRFGTAVAIDGDTVAVGADGEASSAVNIDGSLTDNGAPGSGAVYVY